MSSASRREFLERLLVTAAAAAVPACKHDVEREGEDTDDKPSSKSVRLILDGV